MTLNRTLPFVLALCSPFVGKSSEAVSWNNPHKELPPIVQNHSLDSDRMQRTVGFTVYTPPGYNETNRRFPTLYFLHGYGGDETSDGPAFAGIVDRLINAGEIPPVICVFPNGGKSQYRDHPESGINVESMIIEELIPLIDATFRTEPHRDARVIAGYSMGGAGAIRFSLVYPELFSAAASWAGAVTYPRRSGKIPPELQAERVRSLTLKPRLLMIVGTEDDVTYADHALFLSELHQAKYPFTYITLDGVPHSLSQYYALTGERLVRFLAQGLPQPNETR